MFQLNNEDRLKVWREFRTELDSLPFETALNRVAEFWGRAPFVPYHLDINDPDNWPDPWTLITENHYCDLAKALGIVYTIALTTHGNGLEYEIRVYNDPSKGYDYNLVYLDQGKYILNMIDSEFVNIEQVEQKLVLKKTFSSKQLQKY